MRIILASKSPRRKEILSSLHIPFEVMVSDIDENSDTSDPKALVMELSQKKGMAVAESLGNCNYTVIISSDTVVAVDGMIFGKPTDEKNAREMIKALSGRTHSVFSGISLITIRNGRTQCFTDFDKTDVTFKKMSESDISLYLSLENVLDKAGAYAIQGAASLWISGIKGCYFNVVGFPVSKLKELSEKAGIKIEEMISKDQA